MSEIPSILAIEPDPDRANALAHLVHDYVDANVVVSASAEVALAVMARRMPELILLSAFTPPGDERNLMAFLRESAQASVPVLIMSPVDYLPVKNTGTSSALPWRSRRRPVVQSDLMREALGARMRSALEKSREQVEDVRAAQPIGDTGVRVPRAHRWAAPDGSPLSSIRLASGFMGQLMNISNSGLLLESDSALMPGNAVMFEFADPNQALTRIWRSDMNLAVPAHVIRSEVSKLGPDRFRYRVAARFVHELELMTDVLSDQEAEPRRIETVWTPVTSDGEMRAAAARLHDLARALESLESAVSRICPPAVPRTH